MRIWAAIILLTCCATCLATDSPATATSTAATEAASDSQGDFDYVEMVPAPSPWPGVAIIASLGLFVMAAVIGPVVRAHTPADLPVTHSYDEPPGSSHRHGDAGTANP